MLSYKYRASDAQGHISHGQLTALGEAELMTQLQQQGLLLLQAKAIHQPRGNVLRLTAQQRINLLLQLELQLRAGIPLHAALCELADSDSRLKIGHPEVEPWEQVLVPTPHPMVGGRTDPVRRLLVVGDDHPTLPGGNRLRPVQAEHPEHHGRSDRLRSVLDGSGPAR